MKKSKTVTAWIALSDSGYIAYFLGFWQTKKELKAHYSEKYACDLEVAGYQAKKIQFSL